MFRLQTWNVRWGWADT